MYGYISTHQISIGPTIGVQVHGKVSTLMVIGPTTTCIVVIWRKLKALIFGTSIIPRKVGADGRMSPLQIWETSPVKELILTIMLLITTAHISATLLPILFKLFGEEITKHLCRCLFRLPGRQNRKRIIIRQSIWVMVTGWTIQRIQVIRWKFTTVQHIILLTWYVLYHLSSHRTRHFRWNWL